MKRKVISLFLIMLLSLSLVVVGCGKEEAATELTDWAKIEDAGKIVVGLDDAYPPMGYRDENDELIGFDIDMGNEIAKRLGVEIEWKPAVWESIIPSLYAKKFDIIISGMTITDERLEEVNFAGPYGAAGQAIIVKADNDKIKTITDIEKGRLGTQSGSTGYECAKANDFTDDDMKLYKEFPLAFNDLEIGRIDAIIIDSFNVKPYLDSKPGVFKHVGELIGDERIGIAVCKEDKELLDKLNGVLEEMKEDGTLKDISMKWLDMDITERL